jgi:NAD(P)-dependent dehydrogenase (short-subunit alcohol dehydrogenase family)
MNNWAIILGASNGIGAACAKSLAKKGINIYGVYLRKKQREIDVIIKDLEHYGVHAIFHKGNASNEDTINQAINKLSSIDGVRIKILIHSIAFGTLKPMIDANGNQLNKKNIDMTLDVMSNNLLYWTQALFTHKLFSEGSQIIAMTSAGGRKNWNSYGAISLAKSSLESICRQLSLELAPYKIAVNAIQAGVTDTAALRKIPGSEAMIKKAIQNNPHQRLTRPEDIGDIISLFADYESSWMTGNVIRVDGGEDITG